MPNINKLALLAAAMSLSLPFGEKIANEAADALDRTGVAALDARLGEAAAQESPDDEDDPDEDDGDPGGDGGDEDPGNDGAEDDPGGDDGGDDPGDDGGGDDPGDDGGAGGDDDGPGGDDDGPGGDDDGPGGDDDGPGGDDDGGGAGGGPSGGDDDDDDDNGGRGGGRGGDDDDAPGGAGVRGAGGAESLRVSDGDDDNRRPSDLPDGIDVDHEGRWIKAGEILALEADPTSLEFARSAGFQVIERHRLTTLGMSIVELRVPVGQTTREALEAVRRGDPDTAYDFNHVYLATQAAPVRQQITQSARVRAATARSGTVGIVDTAVDAGHPALRGVRIQQVSFAGRDLPTDHGTAVASILAGGDGGGPSRLLAAAVVARPERSAGTTTDTASADALVRALDWMAQNNAPVVNVSLAGPPNSLVEDAVRRAQQRGMIIVAAVGNDGPAAPPLYPAAYDGVVGVTAVDERGGIYRRAGRGSHVDVAARGVGVTVAGPAGRLVEASGTSYAAPQVAAALAEQHTAQDAQSARAAVSRLMDEVSDAGERGPDPVFGAGVLRAGTDQ